MHDNVISSEVMDWVGDGGDFCDAIMEVAHRSGRTLTEVATIFERDIGPCPQGYSIEHFRRMDRDRRVS